MRSARCITCQHPKVLEIDKAFLSGKYSIRVIADKFGISYASMHRHLTGHLSEQMADLAEKRNLDDAQKVMDRLVERTTEVEMLLDSCHLYLLDPNDPSRYFLGPRAEDVEVVYLEKVYDGDPSGREPGASYRQKALLSQLLDKTGKMVIGTNWRHADPRKLILEAARTLEGVLMTLSKIAGYVTPKQTNVNVQVNIQQLIPNVMETLERFPDAREAVYKSLEKARIIKDAENDTGDN
ncbi:hypothetical protein ES708_04736 [subsurface metagenome]